MGKMMTRGRSILLIFLAGSLTVAGALAYKRWPQLFRKAHDQKPATASNQVEPYSIPPFSTKEPERYQATRIITSVEGDAVQTSPTVTKVLIARDGDRRREEYQTATNKSLVYLEIPQGRFVLSPARKLYADLNVADDDLGSFNSPGAGADFSLERLLNETRTRARYEKLGAETINGRATTKYRVTSVDTAREDATDGTMAGSVTLIWIDDALGMPIRSETSSTTNDHTVKLTIELRDVKQTIEPGSFELPNSFLKVDQRRLFAEMPQTPGMPGDERSKSTMP
jgi:outer membrane lipoprotein-sorting protein